MVSRVISSPTSVHCCIRSPTFVSQGNCGEFPSTDANCSGESYNITGCLSVFARLMDRNDRAFVTSGFAEDDVISFHDSLLHKSDVDLLTGPHWLNDNLIGFYFEYLENVTFQGCEKLLFVSPQVTQCLKMSNWRELHEFLDPLNFGQRDFVFFPVNDCDALEIPGGTHWSLLILSKPENLFYHLDSCTGSNYTHAWQLGVNMSKYMRKQVDFTESQCLQQSNSYDCGIHVLCTVDQLASYCIKENKILGATRLQRSTIQAKRHQLLELIKTLKRSTAHH